MAEDAAPVHIDPTPSDTQQSDPPLIDVHVHEEYRDLWPESGG